MSPSLAAPKSLVHVEYDKLPENSLGAQGTFKRGVIGQMDGLRDPYMCEKDSEAVLGVWLPAPLPTPRAMPDRGALRPLAVGVEKDLGGIDV